jgi:epoxyqueuosine reductase
LGNSGERQALPALEKAARDTEEMIAEHARWAIQKIESGRTS